MILHDYQNEINNKIALQYANGMVPTICQSATGSGKTVIFCDLIKRFHTKLNKRVLVCVHREELMNQTIISLYKNFGIQSSKVDATTKFITNSGVYVGMIETVVNKLKKNSGAFGNIGMLIIDEAHIGNFNKIYDYFNPDQTFRIGFTATPIASNKKFPLNLFYRDVIVNKQINELIKDGFLVQNRTWSIKGINRGDLKIKGGEFETGFMASKYSNTKHLKNTIEAYKLKALGEKTIVFNCNVEHSKLVTQEFIDAGFNAKHLDGKESKQQRKYIFDWLRSEDDAILNNVGVATTGVDEPSIRNCIINRSTKSISLWLQMCGRGARKFKDKEYFNIIDLGGNALALGDWNTDRDWEQIFHNPAKSKTEIGVAPIKLCGGCEAIIPVQTKKCPFCDFDMTKEVFYDSLPVEFELITKKIHVDKIVARVDRLGHKDFSGVFRIIDQIADVVNKKFADVDEKIMSNVYEVADDKIKEWCNINNREHNRWIKDFTRENLNKRIYESSINY